MRVFVAGATGVLGRRLVARLSERGHDVTGLTRDDAGDRAVETRGGRPVRGDVTEESVRELVGDADCVVHAATAVPTGKPSKADWEHDERVRREGARHLASAAAERDARYVGQSVVWVARSHDGGAVSPEDEPQPTLSTRPAAEAERLAREKHPNPVVLRGGWYYGPEAAHTRQLGEQLLAGRMPVPGAGWLGRGDATLSYLHTADAARAFAAAVEGDATGTYHVVDDEPAAFAAFLRRFADELEAPPPRRLPGWLLRPVIGRSAVRLFTTDAVTDSERFRRDFDWRPTYATCEDGLAQVVDAWREDGTIERAGDGWTWAGD
jgi:nucleoside-diphosphate-sugar epimerase